MTAFIVRRLFYCVIILILVSILIFFAMRLLPGDPILMIISSSQQKETTPEQIEKLRHEYGLDRPLVVQYVSWAGDLLKGDMGISIVDQAPVKNEILRRLPITIHLGLLSFIIGNIIGIIAGIICAIRRGSWVDTAITALANIGITMPSFWLAVMLMYFFGLYLRWLPIMGYASPFSNFWLNTKQLIMPCICLSVFTIAGNTRMVRSSMLEVIHQDYIRTAWSKGLGERMIIMRHGLKNALIPVVTLAGAGFSSIIGGSVFIETVFNIPGIGRLAVASVSNQDYPYVQGVTLIVAVAVVLSNLLVDVAYGWIDPRIHYQ